MDVPLCGFICIRFSAIYSVHVSPYLFLFFTLLEFQVFVPYTPQYHPDLLIGVKQLWDPVWIIFVQLVWVAVFLYLGRSRVISSTLVFNVRHDMI